MGMKNFCADDFTVVAYVVLCEDDSGWHPEYEIENEILWKACDPTKHFDARKCDCCGQRLKYACILYSISESKYYSVGRQCTSKIDGFQRYIKAGMKRASIAVQQRLVCDKREKEYLAVNPGHTSIILDAKDSTIPFVKELYSKLRRYGQLSVKQIDCMERIMREDKQRRLSATGSIPIGRKEVIGKVISFRNVTCPISRQVIGVKMLVELEGGTRVYGTKPLKLPCEVGKIIKFKATFQISEKDPLFGFFSRPTLI